MKNSLSWFKCDVGKAVEVESAISEIIKKFPARKISILINNAGHSKLLPLIDHEKVTSPFCLKPENLEEASGIYSSMLDTNVLGPTLVTREAMKHFDHSQVSCSIRISSIRSRITGKYIIYYILYVL